MNGAHVTKKYVHMKGRKGRGVKGRALKAAEHGGKVPLNAAKITNMLISAVSVWKKKHAPVSAPHNRPSYPLLCVFFSTQGSGNILKIKICKVDAVRWMYLHLLTATAASR